MQRLIVLLAVAYADAGFEEATTNNSDRWITDLWACYHPYGNYGYYCMVGASLILNQAQAIAQRHGAPCQGILVPTTPSPTSANKERTLYGNVYDTLEELYRLVPDQLSRDPTVGALFMRQSDNGKTNHAGIVITAKRETDNWIETIEANASTTGNGTNRLGFALVRYTATGYTDLDDRAWVISSRAAAYGNHRPSGWYFANLSALCEPVDEFDDDVTLCLDVKVPIRLKQSVSPPPPPPQGSTTTCANIPKPNDTTGYSPWRLTTDVIAEIQTEAGRKLVSLKAGDYNLVETTKYPKEGREFSVGGCYVRWKSAGTGTTTTQTSPNQPVGKPCPEYIIKGCCDSAATTLRIGTGSILTMDDVRADRGAREALMSSAIKIEDFSSRGYTQRYQEAHAQFPMMKAGAVTVMPLVETSMLYNIAERLQLWGPNPYRITIDRTALPGGVGGGYAERIAQMFAPDEWTWATQISRDSLGAVAASLRMGTRRLSPNSPAETVPELSLFKLLTELEKRADALKNRTVVIVFTGEPQSGIDIIAGLAGILGGALNLVIPGAGTVVASALQTAQKAYRQGSIDILNAFGFLAQLGTSLATLAGDKGGALFGVDKAVYQDMARYADGAYRVTTVFNKPGPFPQKVFNIASAINTAVPELTDLAAEAFADEIKWTSNAFAELNRIASGALADVRGAISNFADGMATNTIGNLQVLESGIDSLFSSMLTSGGTPSAARISVIQSLLTTSPDPSIIQTKAGSQDIFGRLLSLPATWLSDVTDATVHNAMASVASGRRIIDGALDQLTMDSLLYQAEDFARQKWAFDVPMTIAKDKRECMAREIAVCIGTQTCSGVVTTSGGKTSGETSQPSGSGGADAGSETSVLPPCVIQLSPSTFQYCEPPACRQTTLETASIQLVNQNGGPYLVVATRPVGSTEWSDFKVQDLMPSGNDWVLAPTLPQAMTAEQPTSSAFEATRSQQGQPISPGGVSETASNADGCAGRYEARRDGQGRWTANIGGEWLFLSVGCCPTREAPAVRQTQATAICCPEIRAIDAKLVELQKSIADLTLQWRQQSTATSTTTTASSAPRDEVVFDLGVPTEELPPGVAPLRPCCDLNPVIKILRQLPQLVVQAMNSENLPQIPTTTLTTTTQAGTVAASSPEVTQGQAADLETLQTSISRLERIIESIVPTSPCDNSEVLTELSKIEALLQRSVVQYDDTLLQKKVDAILDILTKKGDTSGASSSTSTAGTTTSQTDTTVLETVLREMQATQKLYRETIEQLTAYIDSRVTVMDTETLRTELQTQTELIRELREIVISGTALDTTAIERELTRLVELVRILVERDRQQTVSVPETATASTATVVAEACTCTDSVLRSAVGELREILRLLPDVRSSLREVQTAVETGFRELRRQMEEHTTLLQTLVMARETALATGQRDDLSAIETLLETHRSELRSIIERNATASTTCDLTELRLMLTAISATTMESRRDIVALVSRIDTLLTSFTSGQESTAEGGATTSSQGQQRLVCDTTAIAEAVTNSNSIVELRQMMTQILERLSQGGGVVTATVDTRALEAKLDTILQAVRDAAAYDDTDLVAAIDRLLKDRSAETLSQKIDLLLSREPQTQTGFEAVLQQLAAMRSRIEELASQRQQQATAVVEDVSKTGSTRQESSYTSRLPGGGTNCPDCPAYIERHERIFNRYPIVLPAGPPQGLDPECENC
ncbi:MAG: hypothetical protein HYX66_08960 [Ignavibacteria bacterium]|nr:hypothetical protein [Ignavibacteria bacterium]